MNANDDRADEAASDTSRRRLLAAGGAAVGGLLAGCLGDDSQSAGSGSGDADSTATGDAGGSDDTTADGSGSTAAMADDGTVSRPAWQTTELSTVRGDERFTIAGLDGPVVVQSFAVWCPKCQRQSEAIAELPESVTAVGLNTDPNEDAAKVRDHAESNGFDWRFAVAPTAMTQSLVDQFGTTVTNAPSTPVIAVCESGEATFMSGEVQGASALTDVTNDC